MTFEEAQDRAFKITLRDSAGQARKIIREYNLAFDQTSVALKKLYADIKKLNITEAQYYNKLREINRLSKLGQEITEILDKRYGVIMSTVRTNSINSITNQYYMQQFATAWFTKDILPFSFIPMKAVDVSVYYTDAVWEKIKDKEMAKSLAGLKPKWGNQKVTLKSLLLRNKKIQLDWIKSAISQGLIQGRSLNKTMKLLEDAFDKSKANAMRVVRTETIRNLNAGSFLNSQQVEKQGIKINRMWSAVFDTRTRSQSASMDGQIADADGYFHYPNGAISQYPGGSGHAAYDVNERCGVHDVLPDSPPQLKRGYKPVVNPKTGKTERGKSEIMSYRTFPEWAKENNLVYKSSRWEIQK